MKEANNLPPEMITLGKLIMGFKTKITKPEIPPYSLPHSTDIKPVADLKRMLALMPYGNSWEIVCAALGHISNLDGAAHTLTEYAEDYFYAITIEREPKEIEKSRRMLCAMTRDMRMVLNDEKKS